jgi:hypothetical protein
MTMERNYEAVLAKAAKWRRMADEAEGPVLKATMAYVAREYQSLADDILSKDQVTSPKG